MTLRLTDGVECRLVGFDDPRFVADTHAEVLADADRRACLTTAGRSDIIEVVSIDGAVRMQEQRYAAILP